MEGSEEKSDVNLQGSTMDLDRAANGEDVVVPAIEPEVLSGFDQNLKAYKITKTCFLCLNWVCMGLFTTLTSPTLPDLRDRLGVPMEEVSLAVAFKSVGIMVGSLLGGTLADRYRTKADLLEALFVLSAGVSVIAKPWAASVAGLGTLFAIEGIGHGGLDTVGNSIVVWMWADKVNVPMHALHFGYPLGSIFAPLIAYPFLSAETEGHNDSNTLPNSTLNCCLTTESAADTSRLEIPYSIIGSITVLASLVFFGYFMAGLPKTLVLHGEAKKSLKEACSINSCVENTSVIGILIIVLVAMLFFLITGKDQTLDTFIFSYAIDSELNFSKQEAALFDTVYRISFAIGRAVAAIVSHWLAIQPLIFFEIFSNAAFAACLGFLGTKEKVYMWAFAPLFKFTAAPVFPSTHTWTSKYLVYRSLLFSLFMVVHGLAGFFFKWLVGYLYDVYSPAVVIYNSVACAFAMCLVLVLMQLSGSVYKRIQGHIYKFDEEFAYNNEMYIKTSNSD